MAIRLITAEYCADCMDFGPLVKKPEKTYMNNGADCIQTIQTNTIVTCKNASKCENLVRHLRKEMKDGRNN